jgi:hypothetical protein
VVLFVYEETPKTLPQSTSSAGDRGFNKSKVLEFSDTLEELIGQNKLFATRVFNVDETGLSFYNANRATKAMAQ